MTCSTDNPSPSAARRKALRDADSGNIMKVIPTYPLERYYAATDRLLLEFDRALDERRLDDAYMYGIRFAAFSVESLPKHGNYKNSTYATLRLKNSRQVDQVLNKLERVTARMDAEELARQREVLLLNGPPQTAPPPEHESSKTLRVREEPKHDNDQHHRVGQQRLEGMMESRNDLEQRAKEKLRALQAKSDREFAIQQQQQQQQQHQQQQQKQQLGGGRLATLKQSKTTGNTGSLSAKVIATKSVSAASVSAVAAASKNAEEERLLALERKRLQEEAERLAREQAAAEELEVAKRLARERAAAMEEQRRQQQVRDNIDMAAKKRQQDLAVQRLAAFEENYQQQAVLEHDSKTHVECEHPTALPPGMNREESSSLSLESTPTYSSTSTLQIKPTIAMMPSIEESGYKSPRMNQEEARTIEVLRATVARQEIRLNALEDRNEIKLLIRDAKSKLEDGDRRGALRCMARKKGLERDIEALKGAIFTMETQILLLESAVENREVSKAMQAATQAMQSLHAQTGDLDMDEMNHAMEDFAQGVTNNAFDEEELLSELNGSPVPDFDAQDDHSLLSLPTVPSTQMELPTASPAKLPAHAASWF